MPLRYGLEVLAPGDGAVLLRESAAMPFAEVTAGDLVQAGAQWLRVTQRAHRIEQVGDERIHVITLHTEQVRSERTLGGTLEHLGQLTRERARRLAGEVSDAGGRAGQLVDEYRPVIGELLERRVGPLVDDTMRNDALIEGALRSVYQILPVALRLALQEDKFVQLCMRQRERFVPPRTGEKD